MSTETKVISKQSDTFKVVVKVVNEMVDTIKPTYGPASNKIIVDKFAYRMVMDDGVQGARDFELSDPFENAVVKIIREAAVKTNDLAGDGTTSALIMLQAIINEVAKKTRVNGRAIEIELKAGLEDVKKQLKKSAKQIKSKEDLKKVALVSFDNKDIAEMIASTYHKLGKDGTIRIERSNTMKTSIEMINGVKLDRGYISPYMVTNPEKMEAVIDKPYILLTDYRLTEHTDILPIMEKLLAEKKQRLVIIAENVEDKALATFVINLSHVKNPETGKLGPFQGVAIVAPEGDNRRVLLEDLAILTGAKVFSQEKGDKLEDAQIEDLGQAQQFICKRDESIIVSPKGKKADIATAITSLRMAIKNEGSTSQKEKLQSRLGMFSNSLAVIRVGAPTENEQKALKYKVEDAVNATRMAFGGVVCGSGLALQRLKTSSPILNEALKYPHRQLNENMGIETEVELGQNEAYNVVTKQKGPFMEVGVVDPVDVLIAGVESAVSIASILLTSSAIIVETQKQDK